MITPKQALIIRLLMTKKEGFNVNQIARILNISLSWTHEALKLMERQEILKSIKKGNSLVFSLNWSNPLTEKLCDLLLIESRSGRERAGVLKGMEKIVAAAQETSQLEHQYGLKTPENQQISPYSAAYTPPVQTPQTGDFYNQRSGQSSVYPSLAGQPVVNSVLSAYATSGVNGSQQASAAPPSYVPPDTLASRVSSNISGFTLVMHTTSHRNKIVSGCRYCDSV